MVSGTKRRRPRRDGAPPKAPAVAAADTPTPATEPAAPPPATPAEVRIEALSSSEDDDAGEQLTARQYFARTGRNETAPATIGDVIGALEYFGVCDEPETHAR